MAVLPSDSHRGSAPEARWETSVPIPFSLPTPGKILRASMGRKQPARSLQARGLGSAVAPPAGTGGTPAGKRFLAFYRCQMTFPGISKASGHAPAAKSTV